MAKKVQQIIFWKIRGLTPVGRPELPVCVYGEQINGSSRLQRLRATNDPSRKIHQVAILELHFAIQNERKLCDTNLLQDPGALEPLAVHESGQRRPSLVAEERVVGCEDGHFFDSLVSLHALDVVFYQTLNVSRSSIWGIAHVDEHLLGLFVDFVHE